MKKTIRLNESEFYSFINESVKNVLNEMRGEPEQLTNESINGKQNLCHDANDTHFAVNKKTNLIVNAWDYSDHDNSELRQFTKDYFTVDLQENGFNPKEYKILTKKGCAKYGINPDDPSSWSNDGINPLNQSI